MARSNSIDSGFLLQLALGAFLITLGIVGIMNYGSNVAQVGRALNSLFGGRNNPLSLVVAIVELAAGVLVVGALFVRLQGNLNFILTLIVVIVWCVQIALAYFVSGFLKPDLIVWLNGLSKDLVILVALWMVNQRYA